MKKILIATTSKAISSALAATLPQYEVHICNTGTEALTILETLRPDILILDLALPYMDGLTVLQKSSFRPSVILALTNIISAIVLQAAMAAGVQDMISIPCTAHYVKERLEALTEKAPSLEA